MSTRTAEAPVAPVPPPRSARPRWWAVLGALVCAGLWLFSLPRIDLSDIGGLGLLPALPAVWYVALGGTVLLYLAVLLGRRPPGRSPLLLHIVLVAVLYGTTSAIYDVPRFAYVYKHVGVAEFLLENGSVDRSVDIYNNFPGFFYLAAGLERLTTIPVQDMAQWAQPVFALAFAGAVYWAVGSLTTSRRVRYGTALLFTLTDWVAQNYFAPQAPAFVLGLLVVGGLLRTVPGGPAGLRWRRLARSGERLAATPDDVPAPSAFWSSRWGALALVLLFAAIAVSHQMSPVIVLVQAVAISVLLRPARPWLPVVFVLIEAAWLAQAWTYLSARFDLFSFGGADNFSPPTVPVGESLPGYDTVLWAAPALMASIALLGVAGFALGVWRMQAARVVVPALVGGLPLAIVVAQSYGQEAIFRLYLFGLPWACFLVARWLFADRVRNEPRRRVAAVAVAALLTALLPPSLYGSEMVARMSASDVAANAWFEQRTPAGSILVPLAPSWPARSTAEYVEHLYDGDPINTDSLAMRPDFEAAVDDPAALVEVARNACVVGSIPAPVYIAVGPSSERYLRLFGVVGPGVYEDFVAAMAADPDFTSVFQEGGSQIFRCDPASTFSAADDGA